MCGIAGIVSFHEKHEPPALELLRGMVGAIRHRGPDEFGVYRDKRAGLVNARLSIVDLRTGQQPLANENESLWIVYNGEIFNFVELRDELRRRGHVFRTLSDTEVIVHAYEEWGEEAFRKFNGQWAVALWDAAAHRLILSRDPIGILPLFVHEADGRVWFASEVKAIFADPSVPRALNLQGLDQTFTYWASVAPTSVFEGIEELRPGSLRVYERDGSRRDVLFWEPSYPDLTAEKKNGRASHALPEATERLREALMEATKLRMIRADVPVGSYLSGGLDSSLVAWMGRQAATGEFQTFSIRFADAEFDETHFQHLMATRLESKHNEYVVRREEIAAVFPEVVYHAERPLLRTASAPLYLLSRLVRRAGIKAVLTGEGADEMLAGYDLFREAKIRTFMSHQPGSAVRVKLFERLYPYLARSPQKAKGMAVQFWQKDLDHAGLPGFSHEPRWSTTSGLKRLFSSHVTEELKKRPSVNILNELPKQFGRWDELAQAQYLEVVTLLSGYLISSQGDRMLMAHSVEGRFPFLDSNVMEFCNNLPADYKLIGLNEKNILKRAARGIIPDDIILRKKQPYRAPDAVCFVVPEAPDYVGEMLSESALGESGLFDVAAVRGLYRKCCERGRDLRTDGAFSNTDNMAVVGVLSTQLLYHQLVRSSIDTQSEAIRFRTSIDRVAVLTE